MCASVNTRAAGGRRSQSSCESKNKPELMTAHSNPAEMWEVGLLAQAMFHSSHCLCTHGCAVGWAWPAAKPPHSCSSTLLSQQGRGENRKRKSQKTHRSRWRHLISEKTQAKPSDAKAIITHHLPTADWCPASLWAASALEAKAPPPLFYSNPLPSMTL